jgi:hemoglobin
MTAERKQTQRPLYDRLGGIYIISKFVHRFSEQMRYNELVGETSSNEFLRNWWYTKSESRLPGLKFMRTLWIATVSNGPYQFVSLDRDPKDAVNIHRAHCPFQISDAEFHAGMQELTNAMHFCHILPQEQHEVLQLCSAHKTEIVCSTGCRSSCKIL